MLPEDSVLRGGDQPGQGSIVSLLLFGVDRVPVALLSAPQSYGKLDF